MIWLLAHPLPPTFPSVSSTDDTQEDWERETTWCRERRGRGWARIRIIRSRESLAPYKSFNTFWLRMCLCEQKNAWSFVHSIVSYTSCTWDKNTQKSDDRIHCMKSCLYTQLDKMFATHKSYFPNGYLRNLRNLTFICRCLGLCLAIQLAPTARSGFGTTPTEICE